MARLSTLLFLGLFLVESADADWSLTTTERKGGIVSGIEHRQITVTENPTQKRATIDLALFSTQSATLRVLDNPTGREDLATVMRRENCVAGINGGYFDVDDKPVGLLISDGNPIAPLRKAPLLSGILIVSGGGRVQLLRTAEYSAKRQPTAALQCGPFLVDRGRTVPGLNNTKSARRTFVISEESGHAAIGVCSSTTLAELGKILTISRLGADLEIKRALNLDGGSSTAFWFADEQGAFSISEQKRVRNFVALVQR